MSIISALRTFIATCPALENGLLLVDHVSATISYSIVPMPGDRIVESYINGASLREFPFAFETAKSTADDLERMESAGFNETFADWLESQSEAGILPTLDAGKTATGIEATSWGYLYEEGESETGIYQIICKLQYEQQP